MSTKEILALESHPDVLKLIRLGKKNKEITFSTITKLLPPEIMGHEDLIDNLLILLSENNIEVIDEYHMKAEVSDAQKNKEIVELIEKLAEDNRKMDDPIRIYLRDIGKIRLLTKDEERMYAMQIEKGEKAIMKVVHETDATYNHLIQLMEVIDNNSSHLELLFGVLDPPRVYNVSAIEKQTAEGKI